MRPQIAPAQVSFLTSTLRSHGIDLRADVAPEFTITSPIKFGKRTRRVKICKNDDHIDQCKLRDLRVWFAQQSGNLFYSVAKHTKHTKHYGSCHLCRRGGEWSLVRQRLRDGLIYVDLLVFCMFLLLKSQVWCTQFHWLPILSTSPPKGTSIGGAIFSEMSIWLKTGISYLDLRLFMFRTPILVLNTLEMVPMWKFPSKKPWFVYSRGVQFLNGGCDGLI